MSERMFGLIGYPLEHSFSQSFFSNKFSNEKITNCSYHLFPIQKISMLQALIAKNSNLVGLNVTIPYKQQVIKYLDSMDEVVSRVRAVNTIRIENNRLHGYNSDVYGFRKSLLPFIGPSFQGKALILGTGGASKAVTCVLEDLGIRMTMVSRTVKKGAITYKEITPEEIRKHLLIINTTPLGMKPNVDTFPDLPYSAISSSHYLYDLVYNPQQTVFLQRGKNEGAKTSNGLAMLIFQAEKSWEIWNR